MGLLLVELLLFVLLRGLLREFAFAAGVKSVRALSAREVEERLRERERQLQQQQQQAEAPAATNTDAFCLFGFPLKDNFNGTSFPLSWIERIHKSELYSFKPSF